MEQLQLIVASSQWAAVMSAVEALDPDLLVDPKVGPHLLALRAGLANLPQTVALP